MKAIFSKRKKGKKERPDVARLNSIQRVAGKTNFGCRSQPIIFLLSRSGEWNGATFAFFFSPFFILENIAP
ncbi:hypothetical protein HNQ91_000686 [Filimonas zeae]|uniref:hypothetical protein n=1 Tax=Filimonas zeae TaxID=1737353 RepID=UPI00166A5E9B|nr:hypothetical protein [Filimonas zeae]MDR6337664.1 hypothetical protein [Filimonas zeae]